MKHLHTFESFIDGLNENLKPAAMKKLIDIVVDQLAGQISDEGEDLEYYPNIEKFLKSKQGETAAMSALEGLSDEDDFLDEDDLTSLWPKIKAEVIKKVLAKVK